SSQIWIRTCTGCDLVQLLFQLLLEPCHYLFFRLGSGYPAEYIPPNSNKIIGRKMEYWIDHFMIECALKTIVNRRANQITSFYLVQLCERINTTQWAIMYLVFVACPPLHDVPDEFEKWYSECYFGRNIESKREVQLFREPRFPSTVRLFPTPSR